MFSKQNHQGLVGGEGGKERRKKLSRSPKPSHCQIDLHQSFQFQKQKIQGHSYKITIFNIDPIGDKNSTHKGTLAAISQKWIKSVAFKLCSGPKVSSEVYQGCSGAGGGEGFLNEYSKLCIHPQPHPFYMLTFGTQFYRRKKSAAFFQSLKMTELEFLPNRGSRTDRCRDPKPQYFFFSSLYNHPVLPITLPLCFFPFFFLPLLPFLPLLLNRNKRFVPYFTALGSLVENFIYYSILIYLQRCLVLGI